jgi:hypothetical protein
MTTATKETERTARETADYIATLARELRTLAGKADLGFLAYLLAMVEEDAEATSRKFAERKPADG